MLKIRTGVENKIENFIMALYKAVVHLYLMLWYPISKKELWKIQEKGDLMQGTTSVVWNRDNIEADVVNVRKTVSSVEERSRD